MSDFILVSCSNFISISSDKKGTILSIVDDKRTEVIFSSFSCIFSSSYPGCFYTKKGEIKLASNMFFNCSGSGGNECYGHIGFFDYTKSCVYQLSAMLCSFSKGRSDALICVQDITAQVRVLNSSYSISSNGSPTVTYIGVESKEIIFINCINCVDYCSIEFWSSNNALVKLSNFVNSTCNTDCFLVNSNTLVTFRKCCFTLLTTKKFARDSDVFNIEDCYSDTSINTHKITSYMFNNYSFINFKEKLSCTSKSSNYIFKSKVIGSLMILLLIKPRK